MTAIAKRAAWLLLVLLQAGCAVNPVSGRPEVTLISKAGEREIGREEAAKVAATMGLVDDPELVGYVQEIGRRLAAKSPRQDVQYSFAVVDAVEPNAFALPGGYVYVSRGLLALAGSEDELACVMAHEVAHVAARHAVQRVSAAAPLGIVTGLGSAVTGMVSPLLGDVIGGMGDAAQGLVLAPYSRGQEHEADRVGQEIVAGAGWDPRALAAILETLEREDRLTHGPSGGTGFLSAHPSTPDRIEKVEQHAVGLARAPERPIAASRADFLARLDGLPIGPNAADGVFDGTTFLQPEMDLALRFPEGWKTANSPQAAGAVAPGGKALILLESAGPGDDPDDALRALGKASGRDLVPGAEHTTIGGRPAARIAGRTREDGTTLGVDVTFVAHGGRIYQITGAAPIDGFDQMRPTFRDTATSFRPLTAADRAAIRQVRLRVVRARAGETPKDLATRAGARWSADMVAIANETQVDTPLAAGWPAKLAIDEAYGPRKSAGS